MNQVPPLDELEHEIVHTLRTKADQVDGGALPFRPAAGPGGPASPASPPGSSFPPAPPGWSSRRWLALAAGVALLAGGVAVARQVGSGPADRPDVTVGEDGGGSPPDRQPVGPTAGLVATTPPDDWALADLAVGNEASSATAWQLFAGDPSTASPTGPWVVVGSSRSRVELGDQPTHTIRDQPAFLHPSITPVTPADALVAAWLEGGVVHDVVAGGMTEADLLAFLESLTVRPDPDAGLDAPPGSALAERATAGDDGGGLGSFARYVGPGGDAEVHVAAVPAGASLYGGLFQPRVGEPHAAGTVFRWPDGRGLSLVRPDGWVVEVRYQTLDEAAPDPDPALLDRFLADVTPVTADQLAALQDDLPTDVPVPPAADSTPLASTTIPNPTP